MKQIIIVQPKSISAIDKQKLSKSGTIVIEHQDPDKVRVITPMEGAEVNDMCLSALEALAIHSCDTPSKNFVRMFVEKMKADRAIPEELKH